jgi:hypothetical protein
MTPLYLFTGWALLASFAVVRHYFKTREGTY